MAEWARWGPQWVKTIKTIHGVGFLGSISPSHKFQFPPNHLKRSIRLSPHPHYHCDSLILYLVFFSDLFVLWVDNFNFDRANFKSDWILILTTTYIYKLLPLPCKIKEKIFSKFFSFIDPQTWLISFVKLLWLPTVICLRSRIMYNLNLQPLTLTQTHTHT